MRLFGFNFIWLCLLFIIKTRLIRKLIKLRVIYLKPDGDYIKLGNPGKRCLY